MNSLPSLMPIPVSVKTSARQLAKKVDQPVGDVVEKLKHIGYVPKATTTMLTFQGFEHQAVLAYLTPAEVDD